MPIHCLKTISNCFNPRTHTGCDFTGKKPDETAQVSIHAPTRGATRCCSLSLWFFRCFNPRTHTGCDLSVISTRSASILFQSTHPHGVRQETLTPHHCYWVFQSTHPHGVRPSMVNSRERSDCVSIHAPTRGATLLTMRHALSETVSIHAPTRGATLQSRVI